VEQDLPTVAAGLRALAAICADRERAAVLLGAAAAHGSDLEQADPDLVLADLDPATRQAALARGRRRPAGPWQSRGSAPAHAARTYSLPEGTER
jgi:hypothetical protein